METHTHKKKQQRGLFLHPGQQSASPAADPTRYQRSPEERGRSGGAEGRKEEEEEEEGRGRDGQPVGGGKIKITIARHCTPLKCARVTVRSL